MKRFPRPADLDPIIVWWECCGSQGGSPDIFTDYSKEGDGRIAVACPHCGQIESWEENGEDQEVPG